jgi:hypothetical protein
MNPDRSGTNPKFLHLPPKTYHLNPSIEILNKSQIRNRKPGTPNLTTCKP